MSKLKYTEYDKGFTTLEATYDYNGAISEIMVKGCFTDKLYPIDVERFQSIDPSRYAYIQGRINEALDMYPEQDTARGGGF